MNMNKVETKSKFYTVVSISFYSIRVNQPGTSDKATYYLSVSYAK